MEILADTDDVGPPAAPVPYTVLVVGATEASVRVAGLGTATLTENTLFGFNQDTNVIFFRSETITDPGGNPIVDYLQVFCGAACVGWALDSSIGPVVGTSLFGPFTGVGTDLGPLDLAPSGDFGVGVVVAPEPSTAALLATGLALLARRRR